MARNQAPVEELPTEESTSVESPAKVSSKQTASGFDYTLVGIPQTVEAYDLLNGRPGACLSTAIQHDIAHKFNAQARSAQIDTIVKAKKAENPDVVVPEQPDSETDTAYLKRLIEEGFVTKEFVAAQEIVIDYTGSGTRSSGPSKEFKDIAEAAIKKAGSIDAAVSGIQAKLVLTGIEYTVEPTVESIAEAARRMKEWLKNG